MTEGLQGVCQGEYINTDIKSCGDYGTSEFFRVHSGRYKEAP